MFEPEYEEILQNPDNKSFSELCDYFQQFNNKKELLEKAEKYYTDLENIVGPCGTLLLTLIGMVANWVAWHGIGPTLAGALWIFPSVLFMIAFTSGPLKLFSRKYRKMIQLAKSQQWHTQYLLKNNKNKYQFLLHVNLLARYSPSERAYILSLHDTFKKTLIHENMPAFFTTLESLKSHIKKIEDQILSEEKEKIFDNGYQAVLKQYDLAKMDNNEPEEREIRSEVC